MFQESEIVQLMVGLGVLPVLWWAPIPRRRPGFGLLYAGAAVMLAAWVMTVLEGVVLPELLNQLEHLCHAVSGLLFLGACWSWVRQGAAPDKDPQ